MALGCMYILLEGMLEAADESDSDEVLRLDGYYKGIMTRGTISGKYDDVLLGIVHEYDNCRQSCVLAVGFGSREIALADARDRFSKLKNPWLE